MSNTLIHNVAFEKSKWTTSEARKWLKKHNIVTIKKVDTNINPNWIRYRIRPPEMFKTFRTKIYPDKGIHIIFGIL